MKILAANQMTSTSFSPLFLIICCFGQFTLFQLDIDNIAKITGLVTFFFIALGAIVTTLYYLIAGKSRAELERNNKEVTETNKTLREKVGDLTAKVAELEKDKTLKAELLLKQRKIILRQSARLEGEGLTEAELEVL